MTFIVGDIAGVSPADQGVHAHLRKLFTLIRRSADQTQTQSATPQHAI